MQYDTHTQLTQESSEVSQKLACDLSTLLAPLLVRLDGLLDVRLVRTFLAPIAVMIQFRNRAQGFLLSELGAYLLSPQHAPAGTKRISNLLRSNKWKSVLIEQFLWERAQARLEELEEQQSQALAHRTGVSLQQLRMRHRKSAPLEMGQSHQIAADGHAGLCLFVVAPASAA